MDSLKLPEDTRVVIFGRFVFKLKYKTILECLTESRLELAKSVIVQREIEDVTRRILKDIVKHQPLRPLRSDHVVLYPGCAHWEVGSVLEFYKRSENVKLTVHPRVVLIAVLYVDDVPFASAVPRKRPSIEPSVPIKKMRKTGRIAARAHSDSNGKTWFNRALGYLMEPITTYFKTNHTN